MVTLGDVIAAIEQFAAPELQESYDNTGWQVLTPVEGLATVCSGVLTCVDATPAIVAEAKTKGCNLLLTHHPVMFRGQKSFIGATHVQRVVMLAIESGVSIYSCHTSVDSCRGGISHEMAHRLGLVNVEPLVVSPVDPSAGLGVVGDVDGNALLPGEFAERVKVTFSSPVARCSRPVDPHRPIHRVALCGGSGSEFIGRAIAAGADAYVTSDTRHHDFVDHADDIFIVDIGHHEAERVAKDIFHHVITEKFPNFAVQSSVVEHNPVIYL